MSSQQRQVKLVDQQLQKFNKKISKLKQAIVKTTVQKRKDILRGKGAEHTNSRLRKLREELASVRAAAGSIEGEGSGVIAVDAVDDEHPMDFDIAPFHTLSGM